MTYQSATSRSYNPATMQKEKEALLVQVRKGTPGAMDELRKLAESLDEKLVPVDLGTYGTTYDFVSIAN